MPTESPKYDVAISFLAKDEQIAAAIDQKLSGGMEVFFFPRRQEDLAGTDGLESMRKPFFDDSRVIVVLYREPWGGTPWTRVEETAIKEACLDQGWQRLFFVVLDQTSKLPTWLPKTHVRFNYTDFGLEQAIGAIKARVQENGGQHLPPTAVRQAKILEAERQFGQDKLHMHSSDGMAAILESVADLLRHIERVCEEVNADGSLQIEYRTSFQKGSATQSCGMTNGLVGVTVVWFQPYSNLLDDSSLVVREFDQGLIFPDERGLRMHLIPPKLLDETKYIPDLSLAREYGWAEKSVPGFLASSALAERCVIQFVELARRSARGEISREHL